MVRKIAKKSRGVWGKIYFYKTTQKITCRSSCYVRKGRLNHFGVHTAITNTTLVWGSHRNLKKCCVWENRLVNFFLLHFILWSLMKRQSSSHVNRSLMHCLNVIREIDQITLSGCKVIGESILDATWMCRMQSQLFPMIFSKTLIYYHSDICVSVNSLLFTNFQHTLVFI